MVRLNIRVMVCSAIVVGFATAGERSTALGELRYWVADLPGLGGTDSRGNSVNDWGLVAGYSNLTDNVARRATLWFLGHTIPLGTLGGPNSNVTWSGQNDTGLIVGIAQTRRPQTRKDGWSCRAFFAGAEATTYTCLGFAWERGRMRRLRAFGGDNSFAASANNRRQVVGWSETRLVDASCVNPGDRGFRAVLWDLAEHTTAELPPVDGDSASAATAINDRGQAVGISGTCDQSVGRHSARHAVLWENGAVINLGSLGGTSWNTPTAITEHGDIIVGFANAAGADPANPTLRAFLWTRRNDLCTKVPGTEVCDLGTLPGDTTAQAWGVNDLGQVVGSSCAAVCRAFLWEKGQMKDLNELKGDYPHRLENAMDINNLGQISGRARASTGEGLAFVATPLH